MFQDGMEPPRAKVQGSPRIGVSGSLTSLGLQRACRHSWCALGRPMSRVEQTTSRPCKVDRSVADVCHLHHDSPKQKQEFPSGSLLQSCESPAHRSAQVQLQQLVDRQIVSADQDGAPGHSLAPQRQAWVDFGGWCMRCLLFCVDVFLDRGRNNDRTYLGSSSSHSLARVATLEELQPQVAWGASLIAWRFAAAIFMCALLPEHDLVLSSWRTVPLRWLSNPCMAGGVAARNRRSF